MIERNGQADAIGGRVLEPLSDEESVVQNVVMRKRRTFGCSGRSRRVLDADGIVELQRCFAGVQVRVRDNVCLPDEIIPAGAKIDYSLQRRQLRREFLDHRGVVHAAKTACRDENGNARLDEGVLQLTQPVCGIDVHHDRADLRERVLRYQLLGTIRTPHADAVARLDAQRHDAARDSFNFTMQLPIRVTKTLVAGHKRIVLGILRSNPVETQTDRLAQERRLRRAMDIGRSHSAEIIYGRSAAQIPERAGKPDAREESNPFQ